MTLTCTSAMLDHAINAHNERISVVPIRLDGTKRPVGRWKEWQQRRAYIGELKQLFAGDVGLAAVCGQVSDGLECLEFEPGYLATPGATRFIELCNLAGLGEIAARIMTGYLQVSAGGGLHIFYRCPEPTTTKIAKIDGRTVCETRGEGAYVILAPTPSRAHPNPQCDWTVEQGSLATISWIDMEQRAALHAVAALAVQV